MTDYTTADDIAAVWDEVRPILAGAFHPDTYDIIRMIEVDDDRGGQVATETVVESGRCGLALSQAQGREGLSGDRIQSVYRASCELPLATIAQADDELQIEGRRYRIVTVAHPGEHGTFPVADLEQVT